MREDVRFHVAIMSAAKNDLMKKEILRLHLINRVVVGTRSSDGDPERPTLKEEADTRRLKVLASHREIFKAIAGRDGPAAKMAMENHIQELIEHSLRAFAQLEAGRTVRALAADELLYLA